MKEQDDARRAEWLAGLPAAQAKRHYAPFGREHDPAIFIPVERLLHVRRTDGLVAVVDPDRPWNNATCYVISEQESRYQRDTLAGKRPGIFGS